MNLNSFTYLFLFLPLAALCVSLVKQRNTRPALLIASLLFYIWGSPAGAVVLVISSAVEFQLIRIMLRKRSQGGGRTLLACIIASELGLLAYFKYTNFMVSAWNSFAPVFDLHVIGWNQTLFVLGISFITFHKISYAVTAFRGEGGDDAYIDYLSYLAFFPKLLQGPLIERSQLRQNNGYGVHSALMGINRIAVGLAKKVLIADMLGQTANLVFAKEPASLMAHQAWLGALCYSFQIYFDFSGYTDMAIGSAMMLGVRLPENFNRPYLAVNFTDFWRRWHITLTSWFRTYLYIPLGGNRGSQAKTLRNLWIVFLLSGLWHGANWTFIVWGAFHGLFLTLDRLFLARTLRRAGTVVSVSLTFILLTIGWVVFRSVNIESAGMYLGAMFGLHPTHEGIAPLTSELISNRGIFILVIAALLSFAPVRDGWIERVIYEEGEGKTPRHLVLTCVSFVLLFLAAGAQLNGEFMPYIYLTF